MLDLHNSDLTPRAARHATPPLPDALVPSAAYQTALQRIHGYSVSPGSSLAQRQDRPRKVARTRRLLELLGNPQQSFPTVLVGGTKGKGSTAALLSAILRASGLRVGRYTQPHLHTWRERTWVNGELIEPDAVVARLAEMG